MFKEVRFPWRQRVKVSWVRVYSGCAVGDTDWQLGVKGQHAVCFLVSGRGLKGRMWCSGGSRRSHGESERTDRRSLCSQYNQHSVYYYVRPRHWTHTLCVTPVNTRCDTRADWGWGSTPRRRRQTQWKMKCSCVASFLHYTHFARSDSQ